MLALSAALWFGADVDLARVGVFPPCPFRAATGLPCPGCGTTRALLLLSQLRLGEALAAQPAAPFLLAAMTAVAFGWRVRVPRGLAVAALALVLVVWAGRSASEVVRQLATP